MIDGVGRDYGCFPTDGHSVPFLGHYKKDSSKIPCTYVPFKDHFLGFQRGRSGGQVKNVKGIQSIVL